MLKETARMDLGELTIDFLKSFVGTAFEVETDNDGKTTLTLDEVAAFESRQRRQRFKPKRDPFSIYFVGDHSIVLPQGMYTLRSERLTLENIFIVPIGRDEQATEYEAVFT